jgi:hypothetical protein
VKNDRGIGQDHDAADHVETKRDILALYRAAVDRDIPGMSSVIDNTRCLGCLVTGVAQVGLWLAAEDQDLGDHGTYAPWFRYHVHEEMDTLQYWLDGAEPPPPSPEARGG